jgi:hypothetical protein
MTGRCLPRLLLALLLLGLPGFASAQLPPVAPVAPP